MLDKHEKIFKSAAQRLFDSEDGLVVLAYLNEAYVKRTALDQSPELTYYRLGQKELIQSLISTIKEPEKVDDVQVYNNVSEEI